MFLLKCAPPLIVASNIDEKTLKRDGVCAASLPTTMGIVAGFLVQNTLKFLLKFGEVSNYLGYNALNDYFPKMILKPNPQCDDAMCRQRQAEFAVKPKTAEEALEAVEDDKPLHADNEWGISLVGESLDIKEDTTVQQGVKLAYTLPSQSSIEECQEVIAEDEPSLDELMAKMKSI